MTPSKTMISGGTVKNSTFTKCLLPVAIVILSILYPGPVAAQTSITIDADRQFEFAESYFCRGEYYRAISEYERFIHFFPQEPRAELAMYKIGLSYFQGKQFRQAIASFDAVIKKYRDSELSLKSYFKVSECHVGLREFGPALTTLDNLLAMEPDQDTKDEAYYRRGWIYLETDAMEKAIASFDKISPKNRDIYRLKRLSEEINKKKFLKTKNPTVAGLLAVIPGAGHLYCERYQDAVIAFLLNGAMICAACEAFDDGSEFLGGLITFFELGLYSGNIYSAVSSAHKYNRRKKRTFLQKLKEHSKVEVSAGKMPDRNLALLYKITF